MAYEHFKRTVWSKYIQTELERKCVLADWCNKQFQGEAKYANTVKILGVGKPTIGDYTGVSIGSPESVEDNSKLLVINQAKFFNFAVDDVDEAQSQPGLMEALMKTATREMAKVRDAYIGSMAKDSELASESLAITTAANAKKAIDNGILALRENDVAIDDDVVIELPYFMYILFKDQLIELKTNNDELIKKGIVGMYDNCYVRTSNNLYNDGTDTYGMIRTKNAIAFASSIDDVEAYRPDDLFSDAIKGLNVYGAKVVRPEQLYALKVHK